MGVQYIRVYRFFAVLNGVAFLEAIYEITRKQPVRNSPVRFAMLYFICISTVCVRKIVKTYVYPVVRAMAVEFYYWQ